VVWVCTRNPVRKKALKMSMASMTMRLAFID
jgi:hypothetical protein